MEEEITTRAMEIFFIAMKAAKKVMGLSYQEIEDLASEAFLICWRNIPKMREKAIDVFLFILKKTAYHRALDYIRRDRLRNWIEQNPVDKNDHNGRSHRIYPRKLDERLDSVLIALEQISEPWLTSAKLYYVEGYTVGEIALLTKRKIQTVKQDLYLVRNEIRKLLGLPPTNKGGNKRWKAGERCGGRA